MASWFEAQGIALAFEEGKVRKTYLAIVDGVPEATEGEIDMPLAALVAAWLGFGMASGVAALAAKICFVAFLILFIASLIRGRGRTSGRSPRRPSRGR